MSHARPLDQREVTHDLTAASQKIKADPARYPMGAVVDLGGGIAARVEIHTWYGADPKRAPEPHRGVTLYHVGPSKPTERAWGIDVSDFQPLIDWSRVAGAGASFAIVKATEGVTHTQDHFAAHRAGARAAGLLVGCYHFFRTTSDPREQIDHFLDVLGPELGDLPPALDVEWQRKEAALGGVAPAAFLDAVEAAVEHLATRTSRRPLLYTAPGFWSLLPARGHVEAATDLWCARYGAAEPGRVGAWPSWRLWQYTDRRDVPGIGPDDASVYAGTVEELRAWCAGGDGTGTPVATAAPLDLTDPRALQQALNRAGASPPLTVDGKIGPRTVAAIVAFQRAHALQPDGRVGPATLAALREAVGS